MSGDDFQIRVREATFQLPSTSDHKDLTPVHVQQRGRSVGIRVDGYGFFTMDPGEGDIAIIEKHEGRLRLVVWGDIRSEDPTHIIDLEDAREERRQ